MRAWLANAPLQALNPTALRCRAHHVRSAKYGLLTGWSMAGARVSRAVLAVVMASSMTLAGCFGGGEVGEDSLTPWDSGYNYIDTPSSYEDPRNFTVGAPFSNDTWGNSTWTVYGLSLIHI